MIVDSTALPSDNGFTINSRAPLNMYVEKVGSNRFQVHVSEKDIEKIKSDCQNNNLPLIEEFDFRKDLSTPELKIDLKSTTTVRDY